MCVCSLSKQNTCALLYCYLRPVWLYHIFPHYLIKARFLGNVIEHKMPILICGNKIPTRCNRLFLLQILWLVHHVSGTTMPIIRNSRVLCRWLLPVVFDALVFKLSVWCGAEGCVSVLRAAAVLPVFKVAFHNL